MSLTLRPISRCAALAFLAGGVSGGQALAAVWTFSNDCANNWWDRECNVSAGVWKNNWGVSGPAEGLALPGPGDDVLVNGLTRLNTNATVNSVDVDAGETLTWVSGILTLADGLVNDGTVNMGPGSGIELRGDVYNSPTGVWNINFPIPDQLPFNNGSSITNDGLVTIAGNTWFRSTSAGNRGTIINNGTFSAPGPGWGSVRGVRFVNNGVVTATNALFFGYDEARVESVPAARWRTAAGGSLEFGSDLSGTLVGDHAGHTNFLYVDLRSDVVLDTVPTSVNGWQLDAGEIHGNGFLLINKGKFESRGSVLCILSASTRNDVGATFIHNQTSTGSLRLANFVNDGTMLLQGAGLIARTGSGTFTNNGTITKSGTGTPTFRPGVFVNNGLFDVVQGGITLTLSGSGSAFTNASTGVIRSAAGSSMTLPNNWIMNAGRFEPAGSVSVAGVLTIDGGTLSPGGANGLSTLTLANASYVQGAGGTYEVTVDGPGGVQSTDALSITGSGSNGNVTLAGAVRVVRAPGHTSDTTKEHVIVTASNTLSGQFTSVIDAAPMENIGYRVRYTATQAILEVEPRCTSADIAGPGQSIGFDGQLTADDIIVFIGWFFASDPRADVAGPGQSPTADGELTADDIIVFIGRFFQGCAV